VQSIDPGDRIVAIDCLNVGEMASPEGHQLFRSRGSAVNTGVKMFPKGGLFVNTRRFWAKVVDDLKIKDQKLEVLVRTFWGGHFIRTEA